jgi:hypothetical protein
MSSSRPNGWHLLFQLVVVSHATSREAWKTDQRSLVTPHYPRENDWELYDRFSGK